MRWNNYLSIYTSYVIISHFNRDLHQRKLREVWARLQDKDNMSTHIVEHPRSLLEADQIR